MEILIKSDNRFKYRKIGDTVWNDVSGGLVETVSILADESIEFKSSSVNTHISIGGDVKSINIPISQFTSLNLSFSNLTHLETLDITSDTEVTDFINSLKKSKIGSAVLTVPNIPENIDDIFNFTEIDLLNINNLDSIYKKIDSFGNSKVHDPKLIIGGNFKDLEDSTVFKTATTLNLENTSDLSTVSGKRISINPMLGVVRGRDERVLPSSYTEVCDTELIDAGSTFEMDLTLPISSSSMGRAFNTQPIFDKATHYTEAYSFEMDLKLPLSNTDLGRNFDTIPKHTKQEVIDENYNFELDLKLPSQSVSMDRNFDLELSYLKDITYDANYNFEMDIIRPYTEQE